MSVSKSSSTFSTHTLTISHYNPSVRIIDQFLTPLMLCVLILYISGEIYNLKSTPNDRFFEKFFTAILFTLRVFARNLMRGNRQINIFFHILFWCLAWDIQPFRQDYDLASQTTYVLGSYFIHKRELQFKVDSKNGFFEKLSLHYDSFPLFVFCFDVWPGAQTLAFCLISQNTT